MSDTEFHLKALDVIQSANDAIAKNTALIEKFLQDDFLSDHQGMIDAGRMQIEFDPTDKESKYAVMGLVQDMIEQQEEFEEFDDEEE